MSWGAPTRSRFAAPASCATVAVGVNVSWDAPAARRNSFEETPQGEIVEAVIVPLAVRLPSHQLPPKRPAIAGSEAKELPLSKAMIPTPLPWIFPA